MGRVVEEMIAFEKGLTDEGEFTVFEVAETAVNHAGGFRSGARGEVGAVNEEATDTLQRELPEQADTVDAAAEDEDGHTRVGAEAIEDLVALIHCIHGVVMSFL